MSFAETKRAGVSTSLRRVSIGGALLLLVVLLSFGARSSLELGWAWRCPMLALFHVPCPSCGSTRALAALAHLDFLSALRFNPLLVSVLPALGLGWSLRHRLQKFSCYGWPVLIGAVLLNWLYLYFFLPR